MALPIISKGLIAAFNHIYELYHGVFLGLPVAFIFASKKKKQKKQPRKRSQKQEKKDKLQEVRMLE